MKLLLATLAVVILSLCIHFVAARDSTKGSEVFDIDLRQNTSNPCVWNFTSTGHLYNLTNGRGIGKDYNISYQGVPYIVNICQATIFACKTGNSPTGQRNSVGCQPGNTTNTTYSIGQLLQAFASEPDGKFLQLNYTQGTPVAGTTPAVYRRMVIKCQCGSTTPGEWTITSVDAAAGAYYLTFNSKWACYAGQSSGGGGSSGGKGSAFDVGFIIIIAVVGAVIVYFIAGAIVNKFILKKEGIEVIPNVGFWTELPSLIKDGFLFVYYKIRGRGYSSV